MENKGTVIMESDRLLLRPFVMSDAQAMFRNWASDNEVTKFLTWPTHSNVQETREVLEEWISCYKDSGFYQWAIVLKEGYNEVIGSIGVVNKIDKRIQSAYVGYCIGRKFWHRGITTMAMELVIDFLIDDVGVKKVESRHDVLNPNSGGVMKKCGMKYEGTLRRNDINNNGVCDCSYYGILAEEKNNR